MPTAVLTDAWTQHTFAAMGTHVTVSARSTSTGLVSQVEGLFGSVEKTCSRFDPASDLSRANADPAVPQVVAPQCLAIIKEAHRAHLETGGLFDPRVLTSLVAAGYDRTFEDLAPGGAGSEPAPDLCRGPWQPTVDVEGSSVTIGPAPIDLGGIGKGWTVDAAAALAAERAADVLVNAGGDLTVRGDGPTGDGWTVGVEDPADLTLTAAVLRLHDLSCATSSTARRSWGAAGRPQHHLIDPRTGRPAAGGVASVSVVADSAMTAETWSKALLIAGSEQIEELAAERDIAAYWILDDGRQRCSEAMRELVVWERT